MRESARGGPPSSLASATSAALSAPLRLAEICRGTAVERSQVSPEPGKFEALGTEKKRQKSASELKVGVDRAEGTLYSNECAVWERVSRVELEPARRATSVARLQLLVQPAG